MTDPRPAESHAASQAESHSETNPFGRAAGALAARFYIQTRWTILLALLIVASGVGAWLVLPRMEDPQLRSRAAIITALLPGADAERVESLVTEKIEDRLLDVPEIKRVRSTSRAGAALITVELRDEVTDPDPAWSRIRGRLEDAIGDLPAEASRPEFKELDIAAYAWLGAIVGEQTDRVGDGVLRRLARDLEDRLRAVPGTKEVALFGDPQEEVVVEIDSARAARLGYSLDALAAQLGAGDAKGAAGMVRGERNEYVVELDNRFRSLDDILDTPLRGESPGRTLLLSDVATVRRGTLDPPAARALVDGRRGVVVGALLLPNYRIDRWTRDARAVVADFESRLPPGTRLDVLMEQDRYVAERMTTLAWNLLLGAAAVSVVTLLMMGVRSALLVTLTLPLASLMVLAGMRAFGIPIHQMSVTGLVVALGLLIDNAIIAVDEVGLELRRGASPAAAVARTVSRLAAPLLASTITTALAFAPLALMEGPAGEFVGSIAITVMLAVFSSLFLALTTVPAAAAWILTAAPAREDSNDTMLSPSNAAAGGAWRQLWSRGLGSPALSSGYRGFLAGVMRRPWLGVALGAALPIAGFVVAAQLDEQFFPPADRDQFHVEVELEPLATIAETEAVSREVGRLLADEPRVTRIDWFLGESAPAFYYNIITRRKNSPNYAQALVHLDRPGGVTPLLRRLQQRLDEQVPGARVLARQLEQGPPFAAPIEIRLFGPDLDELQELGERVHQVISEVPDILHVREDLSETRPVVRLAIDAGQARLAGLSEQQIASQLFARLEGVPAGSILEGVEELPVRVRIADSGRSTIERLDDADLVGRSPLATSASPTTLPVAALADIQLVPQRAVITRFGGRRFNEIQGQITAGVLPARVLAACERHLAEEGFELPPGYWMELGGESSERDAAVQRLMANVGVLAVAMVGALVLALGSFRLTLLIGLVGLLSVGLGLGVLWICGYPFGFMAIIGTMGLVGVAINDSIVVVTSLWHNERVRQGDLDAAVDVVFDVTRHVLATTLTTIVGFLPLLLGAGGFWPPLAITIAGGVGGATWIALTLVPCVVRWLAGANCPARQKLLVQREGTSALANTRPAPIG